MNIRKLLTVFVISCLLFMTGIINHGKDACAASEYKIRINKQQNCVTIYKKDKNDNYKAYKAMVCSAGYATPTGTFSLGEKIRWHTLDGPCYGQYCTRITGHILFHSVWYYVNGNPATLSNYQYNRLGSTASHGCVRLCVADAKWVYENCPSGTPVEIYNSNEPGPLGKPSAIKLPEGRGWDPTDTSNPNNPYNKRKPTITLNKNKGKIGYATKFRLFDSVSVKNTVGLDASKRTQYTISYKSAKGWKKVNNIDTKKPGSYRVALSITDELGRKAKKIINLTVLKQIKIKRIELNKTNINLLLGKKKKTAKIKVVKYYPQNSSIKKIKYVSSDTSVCRVNNKGIVKVVGEGKATIYVKATDGSGVVQKCKVYIKKPAEKPAINEEAVNNTEQPLVNETTVDVSTSALGIQ